MYIFNALKMIYIRIPKTGSTSFIHSMKNAGHHYQFAGHKKGAYSEHFTAVQAQEFIDPVVWSTYEKFAFIRHPYDWVRSLYFTKLTRMYLGEDTKRPFPEFIQNLRKETTMYRWLTNKYGGMEIDTVYRLEDIDEIMKKFGCRIVHKNQTADNNIELTQEDKYIIDVNFWREMEHYER